MIRAVAKLDLSRVALYVCWAIALFFLLRALDSLIAPPNRDVNTYVYVAQGILKGEIPYLDRWDNKGPLTYLITLAGSVIGGAYGIWLVGTIFLLGSSWFAFKVVREAFGVVAALLACTVFLLYFANLAKGGGLTQHYALLFQFLTLFLFFRLGRSDKRQAALICLAIGALGGATFLLQPNLVGLWLVIGIYWIIRLTFSGDRDALTRIAWCCASGLTIVAIAVFAFAALGALGAAFDAVFVYNFTYSDASIKERISALHDLRINLEMASLPLIVGWCAGLYYRFSGKSRERDFDDLLSVSLILLPVEVLLTATSGFQASQYYLTTLPVATVIIGFLVRAVLEQKVAPPVFLAIAFLVPTVYYNLPDAKATYFDVVRTVEKYANLDEINSDGLSKVALHIRETTNPDEHILSWGNRAQLYVQSKRDAPFRHFNQYALMNRSYAVRGSRDEFISDVMNSKPTIIVYAEDHRIPPLDAERRGEWVYDSRRNLDVSAYQRFFDFVETEYVAIGKVANYPMYRLKDG